jgi:isopenicillin N synthase-like dioxygenase
VTAIPVVDMAPLRAGDADSVAGAIDRACRETGFFYVTGHGVPADLAARVDTLAREFFALSDEEKARIAMPRGGRAWRGWFPLGGELTSGLPDRKEGIYFGEELGPEDPRVRAGLPLHGANLFPAEPAGLRDAVLEYIGAVTDVGHRLLRGVSRGLGLDADWFDRHLTAAPTILFRIFRYPPLPADARAWSVGEHTDYGLLTLLRQDAVGGLQVKGPAGWIEAPPMPGSFVCNIGDMLDRMTGGLYRSTPHRVRLNTRGRDRLSFPLFFDPNLDARIEAIRTPEVDDHASRWDRASVHAFDGTYGDYLLAKIGKVFPDLKKAVL